MTTFFLGWASLPYLRNVFAAEICRSHEILVVKCGEMVITGDISSIVSSPCRHMLGLKIGDLTFFPLLQLVASWLVEPRCGQPMRKSHSTVSSNGPNQTDRNSSTKFHWTYWHRAAYLRQRVQPDWPSFESDATKLFDVSVICENFTLNFHSGIFRCTLAT